MRFPLVGEPVAIDLANTVVRERGVDLDLLAEPAGVDEWMRLHASQLPPGAVDGTALRALRDALRQLLADREAGSHVANAGTAIGQVNSAAQGAPVLQLSTESRDIRIDWRGTGTDAVLGAIAQNMLSLLASDPPLRACENHECVLHFVAYDRRRRFCSTARCSNRARQARHRERQANS